MLVHIVEQTNLYSFQLYSQGKGKLISLKVDDIKDFLGIKILMGISKYPSYLDYWDLQYGNPKIKSIMTLQKFKDIHRLIHFNHNTLIDVNDVYYKVRPLFEMFTKNMEIFLKSYF